MCSLNGLHWHVCMWLLSLFESIAAAKKNQRGSCFVSKINLSIRKSSSMWLKQNHLHMCMQTHDFSWRWRLMFLACFQKYADDFASSDDGNHDLEIMRLPRWSFSITRLFLNVWSGFVGLSNFLDFPTPLLLSTLIIVELGVHYPLLLIFNFSRGNAEPNHIVVLYYERSPQKKFSTWNAKNFYRLVIRHNRSFDLGNGSNKFG